MFGLGFFEILLILLGILIFIRPQDLPNFVYRVGKVYGQIKEAYHKFYREINLIKGQMDEMVEKQKKDNLEKEKTHEPPPLPLGTPPQVSPPEEVSPFMATLSKKKPKERVRSKSIKSEEKNSSKRSTTTKSTPILKKNSTKSSTNKIKKTLPKTASQEKSADKKNP